MSPVKWVSGVKNIVNLCGFGSSQPWRREKFSRVIGIFCLNECKHELTGTKHKITAATVTQQLIQKTDWELGVTQFLSLSFQEVLSRRSLRQNSSRRAWKAANCISGKKNQLFASNWHAQSVRLSDIALPPYSISHLTYTIYKSCSQAWYYLFLGNPTPTASK